MASQSRETRQKQLAAWEAKLKKRLAVLGEQGADEKKIAHEVLVKKLKAKIKESQQRLRTIDAFEKKTAELAAAKAERAAKPKEEAPVPPPKKEEKAKPKKAAAAEPGAEAKPKKKKKKEEGASAEA
jgi:hypothetical protein